MTTDNKETTIKSLSAEYSFENSATEGEIDIEKRFDYNPVRYDYPSDRSNATGTGYSFTHHMALSGMCDEKFANHTFLGLGGNVDFFSVSVRKNIDILDLCLFTPLIAHNGKCLKNVDDRLYAITDPDTELLTDKNMFKIYRSRLSQYPSEGETTDAYFSNTGSGSELTEIVDDGFVISQGQKYATVKTFFNRFNIEMEDLVIGDPKGIQHFGVYQIPGTCRISIFSKMHDPWNVECVYPLVDGKKTYSSDHPTDEEKAEYEENANLFYSTKYAKRFWSLYDGYSSNMYNRGRDKPKGYPKGIYESSAPIENMVKVNGNIYNSKHYSIETLNRVGNNYLFKCGVFENNGERYIPVGYDGKIRWVKYFNEFFDKFFNVDVTPDKIIEDIKPSVVYECPYKDVMGENGLKLNFVELKNVMTPKYSYTVYDKNLGGENEQ